MDNASETRQAVYILCSDQDTTRGETIIIHPDDAGEASDQAGQANGENAVVKELPPVHWAHLLPNGETILERSIRIFSSCGIRDFVLCMDNPREDLLQSLHPLLPAECRIRLSAAQQGQTLCADFENDLSLSEVIVLSDKTLFSRSYAESLLETPGPCAALSKNHEGKVKARIDFKRVLEMSFETEGVNCFEFMRIVKLDRHCAGLLSNETELESGIRNHLSEINLSPAFIDRGVIWTAAPGENVDEVFGRIGGSDFVVIKTASEAGDVSRLPEFLHALSVGRPLLICGAADGESAVQRILSLNNISYTAYWVAFSDVTQESIAEGLQMLEKGQCDCVLAVGDDACLQIAKLIRFFRAIGVRPGDELGEIRIMRRCPFIAVPMNTLTAEMNGSAKYRLPLGWRTFKHSLLIPEILVKDSAFVKQTKQRAGGFAWVPKLAAFLRKSAVKKPLLVCDASYESSPAKDVLSFYAIPHAVYSVEGSDVTQESIVSGMKLFERKGCDAILAVGGFKCVQTARIMRFYHAVGHVPSDEFEEVEVLHSCPLIVIPLDQKAAKLTKTAGFLLPYGSRAITHSLLLPDLSLNDSWLNKKPVASASKTSAKKAPAENVSAKKAPAKKAPAKKQSKKNSLERKLVNTAKKVLKSSPKLRKWASGKYKGTLSAWYKYRYLVSNQSVVLESYQGNNITCNPLALYDAMRACPDYAGFSYTWAVKNPKNYQSMSKRPDTKVVAFGSKEHLKALARSRFIVSNVRLQDYVKLWPEQVYIQTWHGKPIKRIGQDVNYTTAGGRGSEENHVVFTRDAKKITYLLSPSPAFTEHMISAYNLKALGREDIIRETGYPRNDFLFQYTEKDVMRVKMALGVPLDKKVVLYAPTWRPTAYKKGTGYLYHQTVDFEALHEALGDDYVVMFRAHINEAKSVDFSALAGFVMDMTKVKQVNDLLIISDILISDYSGIIFDYANLRRPIILYQYDREEYVNDLTGVYIDLDEIPGQVVKDAAELPEAIRSSLENFTYDEKYQRFNEKYNGLDGADCGIRTAKELIPPDTLKTPEQVKREEKWVELRNIRTRMTGLLRKTGLKLNANDKRLLEFKDKHKGERCFLIGNGPSLRLEDLEAIRGEYSFCCNGIYRIFDRTNWRPTYYFFTDNVFTSQLPAIRKSFSGTFFTNNLLRAARKDNGRVVYVNTVTRDDYYIHGNMLDYYVSSRATVMSFMIEMAMFMGFKEIYLLGVDCSNGFVGQDSHFINGYMSKQMEVIEQRRTRNVAKNGKRLSFEELGQYRIDRSMIAYEKLEKYSSEHGVKIFNATRGGYLEAFERIDLDSMTLKEAQTTEPVPTE